MAARRTKGHEAPSTTPDNVEPATQMTVDDGRAGQTEGTRLDAADRRQVEQALRDSVLPYQELVNSMSSGVAVYRPVDDGSDFEFVDFNRAAERIEKTPRADVIGRRVTAVFPGVTEFGLLDVMRRVWKTGHPEHHPITLYRDKRITGWRDNFVYRLPSGEVVAVYDDATERKRAEQELHRAHREWEDIFHAIGQPAVVLNPQQRVIAANRAVEQATGKPEAELIGKLCFEVFHGTDMSGPPHGCPFEQMRLGGKAGAVEMEMRAFGGVYLVSCTPVLDDDGRVRKVIHVATDITERKRAEQALRESEARTSLARKIAGVGIWDWEIATDEVFWSPEIEPIFGFGPGEFGRQVDDVIKRLHPDDLERWRESVRACIEDGQEHRIEFRVIWPDGSVHWVAALGDAERDENGAATRMLGTVMDITERRRAEEETRELAAVVRHSSELVNLATLEGKMIFLNEAGGKMLGIDPQEVEHVNIMDVIPEHLAGLVKHELLPTLMKGETWEGDLQYRNLRTGVLTDVHAMTFTIRDSDTDRPRFLANVSQDITERKRGRGGAPANSVRRGQRRQRHLLDHRGWACGLRQPVRRSDAGLRQRRAAGDERLRG